MKKSKILLLLAGMLLFGMNTNIINVKAATVNYDYKDTIFGQRTKEEVVKEYSKGLNSGNDTYDPEKKSTYYSKPASIENPYDPGVLTNDTLAAMEGMTNFYRYLAGVESLQEKCTQNESLQYQALDRNFYFDHYISNSAKPEDMSDELWEKGYKCDHNIIAKGYTPSGAIYGWMNEGYNLKTKSWDTLGHRYALIAPQYSNIQFGYCGHVTIGKNCEFKNPRQTEPFSAYPQAGYMPSNLVEAQKCAWSVQLNAQKVKISDISNVVVKVTNISTNKSYECTLKDGTARLASSFPSSSSVLQFVQPSDATNGRYKDNYKVEITGLTDVATNEEASISYEIKFFDANELAESCVKRVKPTQFSKLVIYKSFDTTEKLKKAAAVLPDTVEIQTTSSYKMKVKVSGNWTLDEENSCYVNKVDKSSLPSNITDKQGILDRVTIPYEISEFSDDIYNTLKVSGTQEESETIKMSVYRMRIGYYHSKIFRIQKNEDGTYKGLLKFDRYKSKEYDKAASAASTYRASDIYNFGPLEISDSGEYVSIFYDDDHVDCAYLSTTIEKINVAHKYKNTTVKPTCTEGGYTHHKCSVCGDEYTDAKTEKLGHQYEKTVVKPTCIEDGYTKYKCSVCGDEYIDGKTNKLGHQYEETVVKPTCTKEGYTEHKCSVCGDTYKDTETEKLGHKYEETIVKPTCTEGGYTEHKCNVCGDTYKDTETEKLGHKYEETIVKPTCTEGGYTEHKCSVCGDTYKDTETEKLGHKYEETIVKPTCTEGGYIEHKCSVCGDTYKDSKIDKLGHQYKKYTVVEATCTEDGCIEYKCSACGDTYREVKSALGHQYKNKTIEPTCTQEGYIEHKCIICGDTYEDFKIGKKNHQYEEVKYVEPMCTKDGYTEYKCSVCGDTYKEVESTLGHLYSELTLEPTCTEDGYTEYECSECGDKYSKKIEKLGHLLKVQKAKRATYFETGYTGDTICTRCEEILEKGKKIKKLTLAKPSIKTTVGKKKIKLVINKVTDATKYEIKVQLAKKTKTYYTTKTTYTLKKLKSKKKYTIKIRAMKIQGNQKVYSSSVRKKVKVK